MPPESFGAHGRKAQAAVDAAVNERTPADALLESASQATVDGVGERIPVVAEERSPGMPAPFATVQNLPLRSLVPSPLQPRTAREKAFAGPTFDELVQSVQGHGVLSPSKVRARGPQILPGKTVLDPGREAAEQSAHGYELVAGERR